MREMRPEFLITPVTHSAGQSLIRCADGTKVQTGVCTRNLESDLRWLNPLPLMSLNALVLCSDDKIVRVLRRSLGDLDIHVEICADSDSALRKLTRRRFEAIVVDCVGESISAVLRSARSAACNKHAVAVAIVESTVGLKSIFDFGAHFVLYKPVSSERAKSSFRAARALMKSERRRNTRVPVQIPVVLRSSGPGGNMKVTTADLSEGGMAVNVSDRQRSHGRWQAAFTLPGSNVNLEVSAEFAWEGTTAQAGLRFLNVSLDNAKHLKEWLQKNSPEAEQDDPPVQCQLSDLTLSACYLELASPFPVSSRVTLTMRAGGVEVQTPGIVRVMHPEKGMGVEFAQTTAEHRAAVEKFLSLLSENRTLKPELLVAPEGLESDAEKAKAELPKTDDPLVQLFRSDLLTPQAFHEALIKQRSAPAGASAAGI